MCKQWKGGWGSGGMKGRRRPQSKFLLPEGKGCENREWMWNQARGEREKRPHAFLMASVSREGKYSRRLTKQERKQRKGSSEWGEGGGGPWRKLLKQERGGKGGDRRGRNERASFLSDRKQSWFVGCCLKSHTRSSVMLLYCDATHNMSLSSFSVFHSVCEKVVARWWTQVKSREGRKILWKWIIYST